jgi:phosphopantetheinyl transferase (holo-ACP synthase)
MAKSMETEDWESATLEASNKLTRFLWVHEQKHYDKWNEIAKANKSKLTSLEAIAKDFADKNGVGKIFTDCILWDVLFASMEEYYYSINRKIPVFFKHLMTIYEQGNIPCGVIVNPEIKNRWEWPQTDFSQFTLLVY